MLILVENRKRTRNKCLQWELWQKFRTVSHNHSAKEGKAWFLTPSLQMKFFGDERFDG